MLSLTVYPCISRKCRTHDTMYCASFTATTSPSVELRVLIFCFEDMDIGQLFPIVIVAPVWLLMLGCTAKDASIHQLIILVSFTSRVILSFFVSLINLRHLPSFFQSSLSGYYTLVQRTEMAGNRSGRVLFAKNNNCATM